MHTPTRTASAIRTPRVTRWAGLGIVAAAALMAGDAISGPWNARAHYQAHVATDKPIYRPGERVWMRAVVLDAISRAPWANWLNAQVQVVAPDGSTVWSQWVQGQDSVVGAGWRIPKHQAGGEYTLKVLARNQGIPAAERKFQIRTFRQRRLKTQLEFVKKGYGPGETASAVLKVERAEGGVPAGASVTVVARVDGAEAWRGTATIDDRGRCAVSFPLPATITRGEGTLAMVVKDGGVVETAAKTIPILLRALDLAAYPEGGDLVAGAECGLYLQARTPWGDPADVTAEIVDDTGTVAATFATEHEGRGRGAFTPMANRTYHVRIARPAGITSIVKLPAPTTTGVSLRATQRAYLAGEPVSVSLAAPNRGTYRVTLSRCETVHSNIPVDLEPGERHTITFHPAAELSGVLRVTVFGPDDQPVAERLLYRHDDRQLKIEIEADRTAYTPGGIARLKIRTTDRYGKPVAAVVGLTVTDDAVLEMVETREQAPRLPQMVLLEPEVERLDDAQIYLREGKAAAAAVDLLLGTQGWRRFAYAHESDFLKQYKDRGRRALGFSNPPPMRPQPATAGAIRGGFAKGGAMPNEAPRAPGGPAGPQKDGAPQNQAPEREGGEEHGGGRQKEQLGEDQQRGAEPAAKPMELKRKNVEKAEAARDEFDDEEFADARADKLAKRRSRLRRRGWQRVYAHGVRPNRTPGERRDFTETLYWAAGIKTNAQGEAEVTFGLSDAVTTFHVMADGWGGGRLGSSDLLIESREPLFIEPKLPLEVTAGDRILLPIAAVNNTGGAITLQIAGQAGHGLALPEGTDLERVLEADGRGRLYLPVQVGKFNGRTSFTLAAKAGAFGDTVTRGITVRPYGFPTELNGSGILDGTAPAAVEITVPAEVEASSIETEVKLYPSPLANLTAALKSLIRQPYGCFEQTSSTSFPMVMAQQYFTSHQGVDPELIATAQGLIDQSYKRLVGFECKQGGFSWFGRDPAHECLTAYGMLQFHAMQKVYDGVSPAMLDRTLGWLMNRRTGKGGFKLNPHYLHNWGCPDHVANAYILWALTTAGESHALKTEVDALVEQALEKPDSYFRALLALCCYNVGRTKDGDRFAAELVRSQTPEGWVKDAATTVVASRGQSLQMETTALAVLAWLRNDAYAGNVEKALKWILSHNSGGRFGSTQATVLALQAIVERDKKHARPKKAGAVTLFVDGAAMGSVNFDTATKGAMVLPDFREKLTPGTHRIELKMADGAPMPYSVQLNWYAHKPDSSPNCTVQIATKLNKTQVREGETVEVEVSLQNLTDKEQPMPLAIIGLPGGLEPRHAQLKELVKDGTLAYYEVRGRDVVAYFTSIAAKQQVRFRVDCVAAVPGTYSGDASRAYLYYVDEDKHWVDGLQVKITAR